MAKRTAAEDAFVQRFKINGELLEHIADEIEMLRSRSLRLERENDTLRNRERRKERDAKA